MPGLHGPDHPFGIKTVGRDLLETPVTLQAGRIKNHNRNVGILPLPVSDQPKPLVTDRVTHHDRCIGTNTGLRLPDQVDPVSASTGWKVVDTDSGIRQRIRNTDNLGGTADFHRTVHWGRIRGGLGNGLNSCHGGCESHTAVI